MFSRYVLAMSDVTATTTLAAPQGQEKDWQAPTLALTVFVSAFLLFQIQPLIGKFILPWFGGSPSVWTTCMLFFQVALFGGYGYAHCSIRWLAPTWQPRVHALLMGLSLLALRVAPDASFKPVDASSPVGRILLLLTVTVGLPYVVLSATGPLLQAWFSRAYPQRSPYRLYALSNVGSLLSLVSYPFLVEPAFSAETQARLWSFGFWGFVALCGAVAWSMSRLGDVETAASRVAQEPAQRVAPRFGDRARWLGLAACASWLLLAATNHICEDVAVIPFLWVVPLCIYLLSFIVAFDHERWYRRRTFAALTLLTTLVIGCLDQLYDGLGSLGFKLGFAGELVLYFTALFCVCMTCHGELARARPAPRHLTEYYLLIAAGGALGGLFVSLLAPLLFSSLFEWPLGLCASIVLAASVLSRRRGVMLVAAAALCAGVLYAQLDFDVPLEATRNFYGVVAAYDVDRDDEQQHHRSLTHGIVVHGRQFTAPAKRRLPLAYYAPSSGVGRALRYYQAQPDLRVGAVGLGVGTLAACAERGQSVRFYEINPNVVSLARRYFSYLSDSLANIEFVEGDARLSLEREAPGNFHVLVLDAFSGDAVPAHLLTEQAFAVYQRHLAPDGVLAVNITNHHLDLAPVVLGAAARFQFKFVRVETPADEKGLLYHADWLLLSKSQAFIDALRAQAPTAPAVTRAPLLWTDHHSDLFRILR